MIVHAVKQGSADWLRLRGGIPTASAFDQIVTPKGKLSTARERYMNTLLAERIMGKATTEYVSTWMNRGSALEADAVAYYEAQRDLDTTVIGFITNDAQTIGASPDRFVGDGGLLEIKAPREHVHVAYMLGGDVDKSHLPQVLGQLWITGRAWIDIMSFHPDMPPAIVHVERATYDDLFKILVTEVTRFSEELEANARELEARGVIRRAAKWTITDEDLRAVPFDTIDLGDEEPADLF